MDDRNYATQKVPVIGTNNLNRTSNIDNRNNDYMGKTKKKGRTKAQALLMVFFYILLAVGIVALAAFATVKLLDNMVAETEDKNVPELVGLHKDEALKRLEELGLVMEIQANVISNEWPKDYVVSQVYQEGYRLKPGASVGVTLSKGAKQILVPDVTTMSVEAAKIEIEKNGLVFKMEEEASELVPEGEIVRQEPIFNTEIGEGDTVTIYVSTGIPDGIVKVPNVLEYEEAQAKNILSTANLIPVVTYTEDRTEPEGKILSQTPEQGTQVSELTEIVLVINKYEAVEEPGEEEPGNEENTGNENNNNNNNEGQNKPQGGTQESAPTSISIDISNKGARDSFTVRVELQGDITGKKILYEGTHTRADKKVKVDIPKDAIGLLKVYIDGEVDSEMVLPM